MRYINNLKEPPHLRISFCFALNKQVLGVENLQSNI